MKREMFAWMEKEKERLLSSGGVDRSGADDDFFVPKIVLSVCLQNAVDQIALTDEMKRGIKELLYF